MDWAELRRSRNRDRIIGYGFWAAGFTVLLIGALKMVYEAGFVPLRDFAVAAIAPVWWIPVVQLLWQLDHQYIFALFLGLGFIGAIFIGQGKKKSQTMRNATQQAQEEHLARKNSGIHERCPHSTPTSRRMLQRET